MESPHIFQFTTSDTGGGGSPDMPVGYPTRYQWETVTSWDVSGSWFTNYYYFQYPSFAFPFYGNLYYRHVVDGFEKDRELDILDRG
jgi:hypothetical protein